MKRINFLPIAYMRIFKYTPRRYHAFIQKTMTLYNEYNLQENAPLSFLCLYKDTKQFAIYAEFTQKNIVVLNKECAYFFDTEKLKKITEFKKIYWKLKMINARNKLTLLTAKSLFKIQYNYITSLRIEKAKSLTIKELNEFITEKFIGIYSHPNILQVILKNSKIITPRGCQILMRKLLFSKVEINCFFLQKIIHNETMLLITNSIEKPFTDKILKNKISSAYGIKITERQIFYLRQKIGIPRCSVRIKLIKNKIFKYISCFSNYYSLNFNSIRQFVPKAPGVYEIWFQNNQKFYIGSSANLAGRLKSHSYSLNKENIFFRFLIHPDFKEKELFIFNLFKNSLKLELLNKKSP